jgi:hypothetical protein
MRSVAAQEIVLPLPESAVRADGPGPRRPPRSFAGAAEAVWRVLRTSLAAWRYEVCVFLVLGLWLERRRLRFWREAALVAPVLLYSGVLVLLVWGAGYVSRRHALVPGLAWIGFAALGWRALAGGAIGRFFSAPTGDGARLRRSICAGLVLVLLVAWGPRDARVRRLDRASVRAGAEWIARTHPQGAPVAAQKLRVAYYAKGPFVPLIGDDGHGLEALLRARRARWVVIDEAKLSDHPGLEQGIGSWLGVVHRARSQGRTALVLELRPPPAR